METLCTVTVKAVKSTFIRFGKKFHISPQKQIRHGFGIFLRLTNKNWLIQSTFYRTTVRFIQFFWFYQKISALDSFITVQFNRELVRIFMLLLWNLRFYCQPITFFISKIKIHIFLIIILSQFLVRMQHQTESLLFIHFAYQNFS